MAPGLLENLLAPGVGLSWINNSVGCDRRSLVFPVVIPESGFAVGFTRS